MINLLITSICIFLTPILSSEYDYADGIVIKFKKNINEKVFATDLSKSPTASKHNIKFHKRFFDDRTFVIKFGSFKHKKDISKIINELKKEFDIEEAYPDIRMFPQETIPNDIYYDYQWHYHPSSSHPGSANLSAAWDIIKQATSVVVAVIDTGILPHEDLSLSKILPGYDMISNVVVANDGNGRDQDPSDPGDWCSASERNDQSHPCYDSCAPSCTDDKPSTWHGLHVAGTISADTHNSKGVAGVNWYTSILPVRVLGKGGGNYIDIVDAIIWAAGGNVSGVPQNQNPAKIINLSLGGQGECYSDLQNAINFAVSQGAIVVVAAGNNNMDVSQFTPANCNNVITVAAVGENGNKASYSNYGSNVFISAPGGDGSNYVWSLYNTGTTIPQSDTYAGLRGTSMATPHVSGIISLIFGLKSILSIDELRYNLQRTARAFPQNSSCNTSICGAGIIDAYQAISNLIITVSSTTPTSAENSSNDIPLTIYGKGFLKNATVKLKKSGESDIICNNINVLNLNQINCTLPLLDKPTGQWSVEVINVDGSSHTLQNYFTITGFVLSSLSPNHGVNTSTITLSVYGSGFIYPVSVKLRKTGYTDITCLDPSGTQDQINCTLNLKGAFPGIRDLYVTNGNGITKYIENVFNVIQSNLSVSSLSPNEGYNDQTINISVYGSGFYSTSTAVLTKTGFTDIPCTMNVISSTYAICSVNLIGAFDGTRDFRITSSTQTITITNGFNIRNTSLYLGHIDPFSAYNNGAVNINIYGKGFTKDTQIKLSKGSTTINSTSFNVISSTFISSTFDLTNQIPQKLDMTAWYGATSYTKTDAFSIIDILGSPYILKIHPSSDFNAYNPVVSIFGENFISGLSIKIFFNHVYISDALSYTVSSSTSIVNIILPLKNQESGDYEIRIINPNNKYASVFFKLLQMEEKTRIYNAIIKDNSQANITYKTNNEEDVFITVFDINGKKIKTLYRGKSMPGLNTITWDGKDKEDRKVPSGIYVIEIKTQEYKDYKRVVVIR